MVGDANGSARVAALASSSDAGGREDALDRVLKALNHPVRRRILQQLSEGPASASTLAKRFDEELGMVSYHLNQVLARECGVVELVDTIARRGALEKVYGLNPKTWEQLALNLEPGAGGCGIFPLEVDSTTWREICDAQEDFQNRIFAAVRASNGQGAGFGTKRRRVIVGVASFSADSRASGIPADLQADART
jgi:DNA-binding transcriptional ArsR family regulator